MRKKKSRSLFCQVDHLELRQLLSTVFVSSAATGTNDGSSWTNAYTDLQSALGAETTGTTIEVGQGTYKPTTGTDRTATFQLVDGVTLQGGYAGTGQSNPDARNTTLYPTILSGDLGTPTVTSDNSYHVVSSNSNASTAVLDGFTITAGNASGAGATSGGGINIGGGSPSISDCIITANNASFGGSGVEINGASLTLSNCTISGNTAGTSGGGVYSVGSTAALTDCVITQNNSDGSGGGVMTAYDTSDTFTDCTITGNTASFDGAGVENLHSSQTLINCVIADNSGGQTGGGVNITTGTESLVNCTISGNSSTDLGGGISVKNASTATVTNCIVWGDTYPGGYDIYPTSDSSATITHSDVNGNVDTFDNDLNIDPKFVRNVGTNGASDYGDLHLQADSPVIDVGSNSAILGTTTDADGDGRIRNSTVDLGAYEYQLIFVDAHATGSNDGSSWTNAYTSLQSALASSGNSAVIDVAQGTYYPTSGSSVTATFQLKDGVAIYGGFAGDTTSTPGTRSPQVYPTILSGDLGVQGPTNYSDNSNNVVTGSGTDSTAVLDGFTITDGNAKGGSGKQYGGGGIYDNDGSPTINDCTITGNQSSVASGGGVYNINGSSPIITNTTISDNSAFSAGGGIDNRNSSPTLINCSITGNTARAAGAGIYDYSAATFIDCLITGNTTTGVIGNPNSGNGGGIFTDNTGVLTLINCTIAQNSAPHVGGIDNESSSAPIITNSILWGDSPNEIASDKTPTITYSDIDQSGFAGSNNNIDADPLFANAAGGNFRLKPTSPAVDVGLNSAITGTNTDLNGGPRINSNTVDMGAYEFQPTIYVDTNATGANTGGSWADAFTTLTAALAVAIPGSGQTIDIAQGTYKPTTGTDRTATFQLLDTVSLFGGFAGNSTSNPGARDASLYPTILSAEIGAPGISDNSYHVVTASGVSASTVLDGFTITAGNADASHTNYRGGGIYNNGGDLTINDCTITGNSSSDVGGGMYNENATVEMTDCFITGNNAYDSGGGIAGQSTQLTIINSVIAGNSANRGGGIFDSDVNLTLTNCTVSGDTAYVTAGGGLYGAISNESVTNCIFWGDTAQPGGNEIYSDNEDTIAVTFSDIDQTGFAGSGGNIDADPNFLRAVGTNGVSDFGNLNLKIGSPAIDVGSNNAISGTSTDLNGNARIINGTVDMGAYENEPIIFVDASATGNDDGTNWANAFTTLTAALADATAGSGQSIDVAQGTYTPTTGTDRTATFQLIDGVSIQGGFAGQANPNAAQNASTFPTILSGDIGTMGDNSDNSYHVVTSSGTDSTAVLEGFTIENGNANVKSDFNDDGGGIRNLYGSPTINDCIISGNTAGNAGGGIYNYRASLILNDCTVTQNTAGYGGGVYGYGDSLDVLTNCTISGNSAGTNGGGIVNSDSSITLINCTLSGNTAVTDGGAINNTNDSTATLTNCILWGDTAPNGNEIFSDSNSSATVTSSDVNLADIVGTANLDDTDINSDPLFARNVGTNGSTDLGDLHLTGTSPAINAGSNSAISGTTTDLDGNARIVEGTVDMGAYEAFPTHLAIITQPGVTDTAGSNLPIVIDVEDQYGDIFTADNSSIAINFDNSPTGATLGGTSTAAAQNGVATFNAFSLTKAGSYTLSFSNGSLPIATSNPFAITPAAAQQLAFLNQPANTTAGQTLSSVTVAVEDYYGNIVTGDNSTITLTNSINSVIFAQSNATTGHIGALSDFEANDATSVAADNGIATFSDLSIDIVNPYFFGATDGSLNEAISNVFTINPAAASMLVFTSQPQDTLAGRTLSTINVAVEDQFGNVVTSDSSNVTLTSTPAGASATVAASSGVAFFTNLSITAGGTYTLAASDGSLTSAISNSFTITASGPHLAFAMQPANAIAGAKFSPILIDTDDTSGNIVTGGTSTITLTLSSNGKIYGSTKAKVNKKTGMATFKNISIRAAGTYTLTATDTSDSDFTAVQSTPFTISAAAAKKLIFNPQPTNVSASTPFNVSVELVDKYGNAVDDGSTVNLVLGSHPKTAAALSLTSPVSDGFADFDGITLDVAGPYTLKANDGKAKATSKKFMADQLN